MRSYLFLLVALVFVFHPESTRGQSPASDAAPATPAPSGSLQVKTGQQIVFLGDSTTLTGWNTASGFIHLVQLGLAKENIDVKVSQLGGGGSRPQDLLDLWQKSATPTSPKADWIVIGCGLDEVSRALPGSDLPTFQAAMKSLIDAAKAAGAQVMLLTTSIANERNDAVESKFAPYNDALRSLAKDEGCLLVDVNAAEKAALPTLPIMVGSGKLLQREPTLNSHGQRVVATEILKTFGATDTQLAEIQQAWLDAPRSASAGASTAPLKGTALITLREYDALEAMAASQHHPMADILNPKYAADVIAALRAADASSNAGTIQAAAQAAFENDVTDLLKTATTGTATTAPTAAAPASPSPATAPTNVLVKSGQKVAFLGDSITQFGFQHPYGYVNLVIRGLAAVGVQATPVPAGVSGNTSRDMIGRLQKSVLDNKPDWMTLSCGVNDVWHGITGCDIDTYKTNITSIVDQAQKANIQVVILTATMIQETDNPLSQKQVPYNDFLHSLAKERKLPLADLNEAERAALKAIPADSPYHHLTVDGVHMNPHGDQMMALGVLKAFGLTDAQLAQVQEHWLDEPKSASADGVVPLFVAVPITLGENDTLEQIAQANKQTVADYLAPSYMQALIEAAKVDPAPPDMTAVQTAAQAIFAQKVADLLKNPPPPPAPVPAPAAK